MSVCLAISSFRNDETVLALLEEALEDLAPFAEILIVDSMGTGALPAAIAARGWSEQVFYESSEHNLGSAGNLARRLEWAAERDHRWVFAMNHDARVDHDVVRALVECGETVDRVGAVFPMRFKQGRQMYDLTGRQALPLPFRGSKERPTEAQYDVHWGSSNGTLYALEPVREGLSPWAELWMGWEDLGYGWLLERHGYRQVVLTDVEMEDPYEYVQKGPVTITDKPSWYAYYQARNLVLVTRWNLQPPIYWATVAGRLGLEVCLTVALRPDKRTRLNYLAHGLFDGLRGRAGKWMVP